MKDQAIDTHNKALKINLDPRWYGTFAEIGAGQEVVRWFFRVGGAAGTVAKSMSAYDMTVSDAIYGPTERYVSRSRLQAMLDHEYRLNIDRLGETRGDNTSFFAFADTVTTRSYRGTAECHGWMGVKFQSHPRDEASQIIIHVRLLDAEAALQQEALGIIGVNLLYGAFCLHHEPEELVESLLDQLTTARIEIDMVEFSGIEFRYVDNRLMSLKLVQLGLSGAAMFGANREVLQPSEVLYKKAVLVERGSFRPVTHVNVDMLNCALEKFSADPALAGKTVLPVMEITMRNLLAGGTEVDRRDFLARADLLSACGMTVLISDYFEYYRLAAYLAWRTRERIGIVMGVPSLIEIFDEKYYTQLPGGILESFGRLFKNDLRLYVYPLKNAETGELTTVENHQVAPELRKLYGYLSDRGSFVPLDNYNPDYLSIFSRDVLKRIAAGDTTWEQMVPAEVTKVIHKRGFFGYKARAGAELARS
ncbi:MAG TPA: TonB-dependent receptor [Chthoniobacteraceae bacterium]